MRPGMARETIDSEAVRAVPRFGPSKLPPLRPGLLGGGWNFGGDDARALRGRTRGRRGRKRGRVSDR